jgi:L-seryl-tRNA(Ser) seleniumtransferase
VDRVLAYPEVAALTEIHGRARTVNAAREVLARLREDAAHDARPAPVSEAALAARIAEHLARADAARLRRVFNLTGTVLHTNLGRAVLPEEAVEALVMAARHPCALEYDLGSGGRGDRDTIVEAC